jgi:hypothetical protein
MYPFYEKAVKAGINTVCVHKGLMPKDYETSIPGGGWKYAAVEDLPKAAKDWPQINFVIYHSAIRAFLEPLEAELAEFEKTGYIRWVSDLAKIPEQHGVKNVYGEIGTAFATTAVTSPRFCAAMMGTLIKGLGQESCGVGNGFGILWFAAMADRSNAAARDPRRLAKEVRVCCARTG